MVGKGLLVSMALAAALGLGAGIARDGPPARAAGEAVSVVPASQTRVINDTFSVSIEASGVADLWGFQCDLSFDRAILKVTGITLGAFLGSAGHPVDALMWVSEVSHTATLAAVNAEGGIRFATSVTVPPPPTAAALADGSGVLVTISFTRIAGLASSTGLDLNDCVVSVGYPIPASVWPPSLVENDGLVVAPAEVCDGIDNDYDTLVDEGFPDVNPMNGIADCRENDSDGDGVFDGQEMMSPGSDPLDPASVCYVWLDWSGSSGLVAVGDIVVVKAVWNTAHVYSRLDGVAGLVAVGDIVRVKFFWNTAGPSCV